MENRVASCASRWESPRTSSRHRSRPVCFYTPSVRLYAPGTRLDPASAAVAGHGMMAFVEIEGDEGDLTDLSVTFLRNCSSGTIGEPFVNALPRSEPGPRSETTSVHCSSWYCGLIGVRTPLNDEKPCLVVKTTLYDPLRTRSTFDPRRHPTEVREAAFWAGPELHRFGNTPRLPRHDRAHDHQSSPSARLSPSSWLRCKEPGPGRRPRARHGE